MLLTINWLICVFDILTYSAQKSHIKNTRDLVKKMNENLSPQLSTRHGNTREIRIKDSIRQGGVLSVLQYALLIDEINKEITKKNLGTYVGSLEEKNGCLLWMDDVPLISSEPKELQLMPEITNAIAGKYHIEFGEEKANVMKIGRSKNNPEFTLGDMNLKYTDKYKRTTWNRWKGHEGRKNNCKKRITNRVKDWVKAKIEKESNGISKIQHLLEGLTGWEPPKEARYMNKLTRQQASTIFKARTRMLPVKNNYRNKYRNHTCRACGVPVETQKHVLEDCEVLHLVGEYKVYNKFCDNPNKNEEQQQPTSKTSWTSSIT